MREIKFRVWDKFGMHDWNNIVKCLYQSTRFDEFENIMQFTGLFDKNGVEIYEGDIMQIDDNIFKVEYKENSFCAIYSDVIHTEFEHLEYGEVIGNIYENPELLDE